MSHLKKVDLFAVNLVFIQACPVDGTLCLRNEVFKHEMKLSLACPVKGLVDYKTREGEMHCFISVLQKVHTVSMYAIKSHTLLFYSINLNMY